MADCLDYDAAAGGGAAMELSVVIAGDYGGRPLAHSQAAQLLDEIEQAARRHGAEVAMSNVAVGERSRMDEGAA